MESLQVFAKRMEKFLEFELVQPDLTNEELITLENMLRYLQNNHKFSESFSPNTEQTPTILPTELMNQNTSSEQQIKIPSYPESFALTNIGLKMQRNRCVNNHFEDVHFKSLIEHFYEEASQSCYLLSNEFEFWYILRIQDRWVSVFRQYISGEEEDVVHEYYVVESESFMNLFMFSAHTLGIDEGDLDSLTDGAINHFASGDTDEGVHAKTVANEYILVLHCNRRDEQGKAHFFSDVGSYVQPLLQEYRVVNSNDAICTIYQLADGKWAAMFTILLEEAGVDDIYFVKSNSFMSLWQHYAMHNGVETIDFYNEMNKAVAHFALASIE